jgi:hypothetical protein
MKAWEKALIEETKQGHKIVVDSGFTANRWVRYFVTTARIVVETVTQDTVILTNHPFSTPTEVWNQVQEVCK